VAGGQPILVRVGDIDLLVETAVVAGTQPTTGRTQKAAERVGDAFTRAQDTIIEVAKSTAEMIGKTAGAARPDRVEVEFGLKFSANGNVIMAGVAAEASLQVTLSYDINSRAADVETPSAAGSSA
jgi:hypothetical protein